MSDRLNIAVFASAKGSNFEAILQAINAGKITNARIVLVIRNNNAAGALELARGNQIFAVHLSRQQFESGDDFSTRLLRILDEHAVNFIVLAGYMKKLDSSIIKRFKNRILNVHPALLPKFGGQGMYGMHVHEAVIASKERISGATVHIVDEEYDRGSTVLQRQVDVLTSDTPATLAVRVLDVERQLYPEAVRLFAEGRVQVNGRNVTIVN